MPNAKKKISLNGRLSVWLRYDTVRQHSLKKILKSESTDTELKKSTTVYNKKKSTRLLPVQTLQDLQVTGNWCGRSEHLPRNGWQPAARRCRGHLLGLLRDAAVASGQYGAGALATSSSPGWWRLEGSTFTSGTPHTTSTHVSHTQASPLNSPSLLHGKLRSHSWHVTSVER
jgi:hypothetical protein